MSEAKAKHHRWDDVTREQLNPAIARRMISTDRVTLAQFFLEQGAHVAEHVHANEQVTYIVEGHLRFALGEDGSQVVDVKAGEVLHIPPDLPHSADVIETTFAVDVFAPRREDWLAGEDAYLRGE
ncbi:MAG TPA: cupin domain-containing protein [Solirubrobacteraceae bacterium]|jgi:quercetin dioxygenase-like cupin family protein|nr:cupin domain-containing protein [Solirubrobacteraceae bacterium]